MSALESKLDQLSALLKGVAAIEETGPGFAISRLPAWVNSRLESDPMLQMVAGQGSGVRLLFSTLATEIELGLVLTAMQFGDMPALPIWVDVQVDGERQRFGIEQASNVINPLMPELARFTNEPRVVTLRLPATEVQREIQIWLPQNCKISITRFAANAALEPVSSAKPKWVHYGSSISHCNEADGPLGVWPVVAAQSLDLDIYNLGLAGQAQLDQFAARTIVELKPDVISLKVGINTINANSLNARTFPHALHGFLDTIREALPETPILISTAIHCPPHEEGYAPTVFNPVLRKATASPKPAELFPQTLNLAMTREIVERVVAHRLNDDKRLYLMSGLDLFSADDAHDLPDDLHPNASGYLRMGQRFAAHPTVAAWLGRTA